ncbi:MAG: shikimate kinase [Alphaproteobacteria bacterium]|nr:shikimate kinase [Alphaproteobacteria bacterium]
MGHDKKGTGKPIPPAQPLVLVGLMGVGKTTVGRRLARRLSLPFVDADTEIEKAAGCSIADIFEFHGEESFREGERRVIKRILEGAPKVISTGGGAFIDPDTRTRIRARALSIWLRADLDTVLKRVKRNNNRPLLMGKDPKATLRRLMDERDPIYAEADLTIDSSDAAIEKVVDTIVAALSERAMGQAQ